MKKGLIIIGSLAAIGGLIYFLKKKKSAAPEGETDEQAALRLKKQLEATKAYQAAVKFNEGKTIDQTGGRFGGIKIGADGYYN